jgi:quercetin dioxygenase-like cupin family protein
MPNWDLRRLDIEPHHPLVLHSSQGEARSIALLLPAGEQMQDHTNHERTYLVVVDGEIEVDEGGDTVRGGPGFVATFGPQERRGIRAATDARLLMVLAPWPGEGHPGTRD